MLCKALVGRPAGRGMCWSCSPREPSVSKPHSGDQLPRLNTRFLGAPRSGQPSSGRGLDHGSKCLGQAGVVRRTPCRWAMGCCAKACIQRDCTCISCRCARHVQLDRNTGRHRPASSARRPPFSRFGSPGTRALSDTLRAIYSYDQWPHLQTRSTRVGGAVALIFQAILRSAGCRD